MEIDYAQIEKEVSAIPPAVADELQRTLSTYLNKCGLYYRIFSRCKSGQSTAEKMRLKGYSKGGKQMQDLIGVRATLYFQDDVDICVSIIQQNFQVIEIVQDPVKVDAFHPVRLNLVCKMPEFIVRRISAGIWEYPIDQTFEIQLRTVFSEGWHEIEHDLRYKNKRDWDDFAELSRNLNGIFAVLETCDWSILKILDQLSYEKYKQRDWAAMLRNHFRVRVDHSELDPRIEDLLNRTPGLPKKIFRADRAELLLFLSSNQTIPIPKKLDNIVYIINMLSIKNPQLLELTPPLLKDQLKEYLPDKEAAALS